MLLLNSESFPNYGLERFFEFAKKSGYDGVEIVVNSNFDTQNPDYLKILEKRYEIPIRAFALSQKNEENFTKPLEKLVHAFPGSTLNLNSAQTLSFKYRNWLKKEIPRLAQKFHLQICRKNAPFKLLMGIVPSRGENSLLALREKGSVCLDLSALWISREEIMRTIPFFGDSLKHVYLSNVSKGRPYTFPDSGVLPIESFLTRLGQRQFSGDFTMKISPKHLPGGDDEKIVQLLTQSREFFEKYFVKPQEDA